MEVHLTETGGKLDNLQRPFRGGTVDSEKSGRNELIPDQCGNLKKPDALFTLPAFLTRISIGEADPLHGPGPGVTGTSGLGGGGENPVELSLYPMVTRAASDATPRVES